jgi:hypothetical protein
VDFAVAVGTKQIALIQFTPQSGTPCPRPSNPDGSIFSAGLPVVEVQRRKTFPVATSFAGTALVLHAALLDLVPLSIQVRPLTAGWTTVECIVLARLKPASTLVAATFLKALTPNRVPMM